MKFKIDENLPREVADLLREAGHDALTVNDQSLVGLPDVKIAEVCRAERRCVVTLDLDFADIRAYPPGDYDGIVTLRLSRTEKRFVLEVMRNLIPSLQEQTLNGALWIVDERRIRIRRSDQPKQ